MILVDYLVGFMAVAADIRAYFVLTNWRNSFSTKRSPGSAWRGY
jgi:hypothetical protein